MDARRDSTLDTLHNDLFLIICLCSEFKELFKLKRVSGNLKHKISSLFAKPGFWLEHPKLKFSNIHSNIDINSIIACSNDYAKFSGMLFEKMLMNTSTNTATNTTTNTKSMNHRYFTCDSYANKAWDLLGAGANPTYKGLHNRVEFSFQDIYSIIQADAAVKFLRQVGRFNTSYNRDIIQKIQTAEYQQLGVLLESNVDNINRCLHDYRDLISVVRPLRLSEVYKDLDFIGLFPILIYYNAKQCFALALKAYLGFHICSSAVLENGQHYKLSDVRNLILQSKNVYFFNHFITTLIEFYPLKNNQNYIYDEIKFALENGHHEIIYDTFCSLPTTRKERLVKAWPSLASSIEQFYLARPDIEIRHSLSLSLQQAIMLLENPKFSITHDDLIQMQNQLNDHFAAAISVIDAMPTRRNYS